MAACRLFTVSLPNSSLSFQDKRVALSPLSFPTCKEYSCRQLPYSRLKLSASLTSSSSQPPPPPSSPSSSSSTHKVPRTRLYLSGLSFRTTEESLRNAFQNFGQLVELNLVMDKVANRPRGFAFLRYTTEEESQSAIDGMHGKFLDGRVIFVEFAKSRRELRQGVEGKQF
ncbi:organelle RRM domain-containing protein 6, chloroplastic isoform X2 [Mercurialis annua]|uniref:organelle RRM domain-containing protein 6, chloroplastic isoform X2 n=1 Tax=Mercurialis annua TaxID=3986 RepID=UPI00215E401C|nr:organelle RRM domain-containing protein 6, chloroplastic isoform X2 [Mercurialis annua]XP_050215419.1 organelle RRM domain-containing protein 6, chloroplastic isoform X2 [Mercurialis annua]